MLQESSERHQLLWFLSGLISSTLMVMWVLAAYSPCEFSSTFTSLFCLWLRIQTPSRWGLLSAFHCIPHWFGLVCELRRPPPGSAQSQSLFRLHTAGLSPDAPSDYFLSLRKWKQCNKIKLLFYCMWTNCQYLYQCAWPFGHTFTSSEGSAMVKTVTSKPWSCGAVIDKTNCDKNTALCSFVLGQDLIRWIITDWKMSNIFQRREES